MTNNSVMMICGQRSKGQQICLSKAIKDSLSVFWNKDSALEILQCCLFDHHSITFHKIHITRKVYVANTTLSCLTEASGSSSTSQEITCSYCLCTGPQIGQGIQPT